MNPIDKLTALFERFPGIGPRQARRFVQHLLGSSGAARSELADLIKSLGAQTAQCKKCYRWFVREGQRSDLCAICGNPERTASLLFVVEKEADIDNVERSGFRGLYFVLGGTIPLGSDTPESSVRVQALMRRIGAERLTLGEIILGLSATAEGDHTRQIVAEKIRQLGADTPKVTSLGRGLSTGSELEYADPDTIASALSSRH